MLAPDLKTEMALTPEMLSTIASAFFFSYALMQLPTGIFLDRFGPRLTLGCMLLFTTAGAGMFAAATSPSSLVLGRILMGIGCAGTFTGAFYVLNRWLAQERLVTQIGAVNSFAAVGTLCAAAPLAVLVEYIGWRSSYWIFATAISVLTVAMLMMMQDRPPGRPVTSETRESLRQMLAGVGQAARQPAMWRLLVVGLPMSAASIIMGAWGAPYLKDVHGLDSIEQGQALLGMGACSIAGHYTYARLASYFNSIRTVIVAGGIIITASLAVLVAWPGLPLWAASVLFCLIGLASAYPTLAHTQTRGLVPPHLVGRGVSVTNLGIMTSIALTQLGFGWIIGAFPAIAGTPPEIAYRWAFGTEAVLAVVALVIYARARDVRPCG